MIPFKDFISESLNKPAKWKLTFKTKVSATYKWSIGEYDYSLLSIFYNESTKRIIFSIMNPPSGTGETTDASGTGNEQRVFATVLDILRREIITDVNTSRIIFSAEKSESGSRTALYFKLIKKYIPNEWNFRADDKIEQIGFTLYRR